VSADEPSLLVRPMRAEDVPGAERLTDESYHEVDLAEGLPGGLVPVRRSAGRSRAWQERTLHLLGTDPGGCWVAERDGEPVGIAVSSTRELMWILASFAVRPEVQGLGVGRALLDAAAAHGRGCLRGMLASSADPRAVRRYRSAGFDLHPQMLLHGTVDRAAIPPPRHVREARPGDTDLMDSVDRRARGAAHGPDHELLARSCRGLVVDRPGSSGYAWVDGAGVPVLLAATDRRTATALMWEALASAGHEPVTVARITAANGWAVDVGLAARLAVHQLGYLCLRHMKPPTPYLHHSSFL
jgi:GNAT superfamily N-acetyltransferase